jgi:uncharacterized protein (TIGR00730 family)
VRICVFCGSSSDIDPRILVASQVLGQLMAKRNVGLVYGGASVGAMGAIADACLANGGEVVGVIPQLLVDRELAHKKLTRLEIVQTMHQRKARMAELSDAIAVLPGGLGTLDEAFEIITWKMLGMHQKRICFLDVLDFWHPLRTLLDQLVQQRMVQERQLGLFTFCPTPEMLLTSLGVP